MKRSERAIIPGMTRKETAAFFGVHWKTVEKWEQAGKHPRYVDCILELWDRAISLLENDFNERQRLMDTVNLPGLLVAISTLRLYSDGRES